MFLEIATLELAINSIIYIEFLDGRFADPRMATDLECLRISIIISIIIERLDR